MTKFNINYKSGRQVIIEAKEFKVTVNSDTDEILGLSATEMTPHPMHVGLNEIESIWETK